MEIFYVRLAAVTDSCPRREISIYSPVMATRCLLVPMAWELIPAVRIAFFSITLPGPWNCEDFSWYRWILYSDMGTVAKQIWPHPPELQSLPSYRVPTIDWWCRPFRSTTSRKKGKKKKKRENVCPLITLGCFIWTDWGGRGKCTQRIAVAITDQFAVLKNLMKCSIFLWSVCRRGGFHCCGRVCHFKEKSRRRRNKKKETNKILLSLKGGRIKCE